MDQAEIPGQHLLWHISIQKKPLNLYTLATFLQIRLVAVVQKP